MSGSITAVSTTTEPRKVRTIFRRLWRGEVSLPATYWLWGVLGSPVVTLCCFLLFIVAQTLEKAVPPPLMLPLLIAGLLVVLGWPVFTSVAIFRSGAAYRRKFPRRPWGWLAQVIACLTPVAALGNAVLRASGC